MTGVASEDVTAYSSGTPGYSAEVHVDLSFVRVLLLFGFEFRCTILLTCWCFLFYPLFFYQLSYRVLIYIKLKQKRNQEIEQFVVCVPLNASLLETYRL